MSHPPSDGFRFHRLRCHGYSCCCPLYDTEYA
jgi:hypothetical protein